MHEVDGAVIYTKEIPSYVGTELERLYECIYCTLGRFAIYGEDADASTYVARRDGQISAVIIFRFVGSCLFVINQQMHISPIDLLQFVATVFRRYKTIRRIRFYAMESTFDDIGYSFVKFPSVEENIIYLPSTPEQFMSSLGTSTRRNLRSSERKLLKSFPSFRYEIRHGAEVPEQTIREIFALSDLRMEVKKQNKYLEGKNAECIVRLVQLHGYVGIATINGRICAGNICYCVGTRYFMHIVAHDPEFDVFMLGKLSLYWASCDCINRGGRECWLMGGGRRHKSRFSAQTKHLNTIIIFRSRLIYFTNIGFVLMAKLRSLRHAFKEEIIRLNLGEPASAGTLSGFTLLVRTAQRLAFSRNRASK